MRLWLQGLKKRRALQPCEQNFIGYFWLREEERRDEIRTKENV